MLADISSELDIKPTPFPAKILVVEDEAIVAMELSFALNEMKYEVCGWVDNGLDAIAYARKHKPDLILMDIVIQGDMDGIETAKKITHLYNIPVIFLTAYSDAKTVERAAHTAPYGYLTKPYREKELHAVVEVALYKAKLERQLRESERWFTSTLRCVADGVVATDKEGRVSFMNPAAESMLGWPLEEVRGRELSTITSLMDAHTQTPISLPARRAIEENSVVGIDFGSLLVTRSGKSLPIDDSAAPIKDESGATLGAVMVFRDVRERLEAETKLKQSEARFRNAFDFAPVGMALIGLNNQFLQVNEALCILLGCTETELLGADQMSFTHHEDFIYERECQNELLTDRTTSAQFEKRYRSKDGVCIWCLVGASVLKQNDQLLCFLYQIHNVTERKEAEYRLARLAHFDSLTGLANRARLGDEIEHQILLSRRHQKGLAVVFIDLDHFKQINDSLGHEAGDELLKIVAAKLMSSVREIDTVARLGGDEFVLLLLDIHSAEDVLTVTDKIFTECAKPICIAGKETAIGISLGVSLFPEDAKDSSTLLRYADSALYHAKAEGRNNLQFYRPELMAKVEQRLQLGAGLRLALKRNEFELHYQPIVSLSDGKPQMIEALIRWHHPRLGLLYPTTFIPLAEEIGLSVPIGEWVIREACRQAGRWNTLGKSSLIVSVNVSPQQFRTSDLVTTVKKSLSASALAPEQLCLEITEELLLENSEKVLSVITELKSMGVKIAIDDFGVGYSSLSYLTRLAPSEVKIDRSLIQKIPTNPDDVAIVKAVISLAHSLNLRVVTEGVETEAQKIFLIKEECDMAQGFLYAHPYPLKELIPWLKLQTA